MTQVIQALNGEWPAYAVNTDGRKSGSRDGAGKPEKVGEVNGPSSSQGS